VPLGLNSFAPTRPAKGPMFGARLRANVGGAQQGEPAVPERDISRDGLGAAGERL
jgi:hypothetical protein